MLFMACAAISASAQQTNDSLKTHWKYQSADNRMLWINTENAAGLGIDRTSNRGLANVQYTYDGGNFYRVQEGRSKNEFRFFTESYQQLSKVLYAYGKFDFKNGRVKDKAWADVMRPYNSNPYFAGSAIQGRYDNQDIQLTAAIGTTTLGNWNFGAKLDYNLGDLSRLRDPRSRAQLLDYRIAPAVIYHIGKQAIGLSGWYERRKEKISGLSTVQQDASLVYYQMVGMENANGLTGAYSAFQREWVNHVLGAELSFNYQAAEEGLKTLTSVSLQRGSESVLGQYKYSPGHYYTYTYGFKHQMLIPSGKMLHRIDLGASYQEGYADEYRQQLSIITNASTGNSSYRYDNLFTFKKRYQVKLLNFDAHYRFSGSLGTLPWAYAGVKANYQQVENKYLLNTSKLRYGRLKTGVEVGGAYKRVSLNLEGGYAFATKHRLDLADNTTDYAQNVLLPDMKYYTPNYGYGHVDIAYEQPVNFKKMQTNFYIKGWCDALKTQKYESRSYDRYQLGISIGVLY